MSTPLMFWVMVALSVGLLAAVGTGIWMTW